MSIEKTYAIQNLPNHIFETGVARTVAHTENGHIAETIYTDPWFKNYNCTVTTPYTRVDEKKMIDGVVTRAVSSHQPYSVTQIHFQNGKPVRETRETHDRKTGESSLQHEKILSTNAYSQPVELEIAPVSELSKLPEQHKRALAYFLEEHGIIMQALANPAPIPDETSLLIEIAKATLRHHGYSQKPVPPANDNGPM